MADTILILGNGFDLAMGRKTSYEDFLRFIDYFYIINKLGSANISYSDINGAVDRVKARFNDCFSFVLGENVGLLEYFLNLTVEEIIILFQNSIIEVLHKENEDFQTVFLEFLNPKLHSWMGEFGEDLIDEVQERIATKQIPIKIEEVEKCFSEGLSFGVLNRASKYNLYIDFIRSNKSKLGRNWSNIELVIADLVEALSDIKENLQDYYAMIKIEKNLSYIDIRNLSYSIENFRHKSNYEAFKFILENLEREFENSPDLSDVQLINNLNEKLVTDLKILTGLLELYLFYISKVDFESEKISKSKTVLDAIQSIKESKVINFNYTDTAWKLFDIPYVNTHYIHGKIEQNRQKDSLNTMVFGIEDKDDEVESINSDLIPFQKFYQRTVKETGNDFELFFKPTTYNVRSQGFYSVSKKYPKNIIVFGHSVDPLDKEIFRKCFNLAEQGGYQYQFLFCYHNESAKLSIVKNLAIILGKNKLIELTGKNKIKFIKYDDVNRMKKELY